MITHRFFWFLTVLIELFFFGGVVFGFPFIEFELKKEGVFYATACANGTETWSDGKTLCNKALKLYNTLFAVASVSCMLGAFLVGFLVNKFGIFWTRMIYCTTTSLGYLLMSLYTANELLLFPGLVLLGFPGLGFLVTNIICVPFLGNFATIAIIVFSGTFDASSALFLALTKLDNFALSTMFGFFAIMSILPHLRTFFVMPFNLPNEDFKNGNFKNSNLIAKIRGNLEDQMERNKENDVPLKKSYSSPVFILFLVAYVINNTRVKSLQGWIYPWMEWSYAKVAAEKAQIEAHVGGLLDIYGWLLFASPLVAALPAAISKVGSRLNKNGRLNGDLIALAAMMIFSAAACSVCSGQMIYRATSLDDNANSYILIFLFSILKTIVYACPHLFLFNLFPLEHYGILNGLATAPAIGTLWLIDPLFRLILGEADELADANFAPVSTGFAVVCGLCLIQVFIPKFGLIAAARKLNKKSNKIHPEI